MMTPVAALQRWRHRHGFGIHSPWAYEFVRDALFETAGYYAFLRLQGTRADEQLFRIILWLQPQLVMQEGISDSGLQYMRAAKTDICVRGYDPKELKEDSCVIVEDIHKTQRQRWRDILNHPRRTAAFDIALPKTCRGIAFFDPARQRQTYTA